MQYGENCRIIEEVNQSGLGHQLNIVLIALFITMVVNSL
jgi:hypothetical protein